MPITDRQLLEEIRADCKRHGVVLAKLDERTEQHGERMDRMDARSAKRGGSWGGGAGAFAGGFVAALLHFLGLGGK